MLRPMPGADVDSSMPRQRAHAWPMSWVGAESHRCSASLPPSTGWQASLPPRGVWGWGAWAGFGGSATGFRGGRAARVWGEGGAGGPATAGCSSNRAGHCHCHCPPALASPSRGGRAACGGARWDGSGSAEGSRTRAQGRAARVACETLGLATTPRRTIQQATVEQTPSCLPAQAGPGRLCNPYDCLAGAGGALRRACGRRMPYACGRECAARRAAPHAAQRRAAQRTG